MERSVPQPVRARISAQLDYARRQFLPVTFVLPSLVAWPLPRASVLLYRCSSEGVNREINVYSQGLPIKVHPD
jgi:hypothetical protein